MTGTEIKKIREQLNLTQFEFAQKLGIRTINTVSKWENDKCRPSKRFLVKIKVLTEEQASEL